MATHHFTPTVYHVTIGPHEPVLEISDGDTVVTSTVDTFGRDATDEVVTTPGNPQTGPFYIRGAAEGDTLAVRFDKLVPNREIGRTGISIAAHVLEPNHAARGGFPKGTLDWRMDVEKWTATLVSPEFPSGPLTIPLDPMVGCFGNAPRKGQFIYTDTSFNSGGNMDYRGFNTGTTVYLPVFEEGALFFLGDGHAVQGDGEIVGTGIEISFDVQFTVRLIKGKTIGWPRGETKDLIFTAGNARPLDAAVQIATTEMVRWLGELGLEEKLAHILLGQCVEYEVGNFFDPAYTMVCKVRKNLLKQIGLKSKSEM